MLGWEFPPLISGGLGTACYGLTKSLSRQQVAITFVLPKPLGGELPQHMNLLAPQATAAATGDRSSDAVSSTYTYTKNLDFENVIFKAVPAQFHSPYPDSLMMDPQARHTSQLVARLSKKAHRQTSGTGAHDATDSNAGSTHHSPGLNYQGDLIADANRYASLCMDLAKGQSFDVIHAHDWLTFPAGMALAKMTGKPLIVHIHSTEIDRVGNPNSLIFQVEQQGLQAADRVIAVSHYTRSILQRCYNIASDKVDVIYNGIEPQIKTLPCSPRANIAHADKIVLYLGRITMQKGPEYFIQAAVKVLSKYENVKFVMAGSGDMIGPIIKLAATAGIAHKILFTGFLQGDAVKKIYQMADLYVMPSVSEPFGITPLEAISHDVPVIISKQSGVSEVIRHALKVDFWDTDEMANKIISVLKHPPLGKALRENAEDEIKQLTWDDAAVKCLRSYQKAKQAQNPVATPAPSPTRDHDKKAIKVVTA